MVLVYTLKVIFETTQMLTFVIAYPLVLTVILTYQSFITSFVWYVSMIPSRCICNDHSCTRCCCFPIATLFSFTISVVLLPIMAIVSLGLIFVYLILITTSCLRGKQYVGYTFEFHLNVLREIKRLKEQREQIS